MVSSQAALKEQEGKSTEVDERTPWQKAEYERRRTCYRKEFKNLCIQHLKFLNHKESLIDFDRLFNVWQLYIKYKKLDSRELLKHISKQSLVLTSEQQENLKDVDMLLAKEKIENRELLLCVNLLIEHAKNRCKIISNNSTLLEKQIIGLNNDIKELKSKKAFIKGSLLKFLKDHPEKKELVAKDFIDVIKEDDPHILIDGSFESNLAKAIEEKLLNDAHCSELKMEIIHASVQELEILDLKRVLEGRKKNLLELKEAYGKFDAYLTNKQTEVSAVKDNKELKPFQTDLKNYKQTIEDNYNNSEKQDFTANIKLELEKENFDNGMLQITLMNEQEAAELNTFEYRAFKQQEITFKRMFKRHRENDAIVKNEIIAKLTSIKEYKENRQSKIKSDFKSSRIEIERNINNGKTQEEIEKLKQAHKDKYEQAEEENNVNLTNENILYVPPNPPSSLFNLEKERNEVIVAIAQTVCESLSRLAVVSAPRTQPKSPQEIAGLNYTYDLRTVNLLEKNYEIQEKAISDLIENRKNIHGLGEEINKLIKELE